MESKGIILFDGVCNLCNAFVQKIIRNDDKDYFRFASLQSETAKKLLKSYPEIQHLSTLVFIENGKIFTRSTAALKISKHLKGIWSVAQVAVIFPEFLRDAVYNFVAKNRYRWFGIKQHCMVPSPELKSKFLD